ncbi:MAG: transcription antitermination factor NusB [Gammaproteobacteria bacterium]|jgi:N utilization substance protein B|nr:transcription antitermination factor NusB [Gammaproteobacteria bacterium]
MNAKAKGQSGHRARSMARRCVAQALYQWQMTNHDAGAIDPQFLVDETEGAVDRKYFDSLLREVIDQVDELDELLTPLLDRPLREVDPVERAVLRLGACELRFHPEIPFRVVINESVEIAKLFGAHHGHKYVNGILDRLAERLRGEEVAIMTRK